jgi:hypothetical protein
VSAELPVSERTLPTAPDGQSANGFSLGGLRRRFFAAAGDEATVDRGGMARSFALLYGAGATLVFATIPLATPADRFLPGLIAPPVIAYGVVGLLMHRRERLPLLVSGRFLRSARS